MLPERPRLSILMPVRNAAETVEATLASLSRASAEGELVVVDDGSSDGSAERVRAAWPGRLTLLRPGRVGLIRALQLGLAACRAPLVARMDADDLAHPDRLATQARWLETRPDLDVVGCQVSTFREDGEAQGGWRHYDAWHNGLLTHPDMARERFVESPVAHPSVVFRADRVRAVGGYRQVPWPEDYDLWLRAFAGGLRFAKVPEVLLRWRDRPARTSRTDPRYGPEAFLACKVHHLVRGPLAARPTVAVWGAGRGGRRLARALGAEGVRTAAFVDIDPRKIDGDRVLSPEDLPRLAGLPVLAAVGSRGARALIRDRLVAAGREEGRDFWCVA